MTYERAIEILDPTHREKYDDLETVNEACRMGMDALKKQMAQPVEKMKRFFVGKKVKEIYYHCPVCGIEIDYQFDDDNFSPSVDYCWCCGQKLDWSVIDD